MTDKSVQNILMPLKTRQEALALADSLAALEQGIFDVKSPIDHKLRVNLESDIYERFMDYLAARKISNLDYLKVLEALKDIRKAIEEIPTVTISIAFQPSKKFIDSLSSHVSKELGVKVFVELVIDSSVVAGAKISCGGSYKDYSIAKLLDGYFEEKMI